MKVLPKVNRGILSLIPSIGNGAHCERYKKCLEDVSMNGKVFQDLERDALLCLWMYGGMTFHLPFMDAFSLATRLYFHRHEVVDKQGVVPLAIGIGRLSAERDD